MEKKMNNEELNQKIAEVVMGWEDDNGIWVSGRTFLETGYSSKPTYKNYFSPATDLNHLKIVLDKAREDGWQIGIWMSDPSGNYDYVELMRPNMESEEYECIQSDAPYSARNACLAICKAYGLEVKE